MRSLPPLTISQTPNVGLEDNQLDNRIRTLKRRFHDRALTIDRHPQDISASTVTLESEVQVKFNDEKAADRYFASLTRRCGGLEPAQKKIGQIVFGQIGSSSSSETSASPVTVDILATEGAVAEYVLERVFASLRDAPGPRIENVDITLYVSNHKDPQFAYAREQTRLNVGRIRAQIAPNVLDKGLLKEMNLRCVTLEVVAHALPPVLHGFKVGDSWAACGVVDWTTMAGYPAPQATCRGNAAPFTVVNDPEDGLLQTYRNWTRTARESGKLLGTSKSTPAQGFSRRLGAWLQDELVDGPDDAHPA